MKRAVRSTQRVASERKNLRRRGRQFYRRFNEGDWQKCYAQIDPRLTQQRKTEPSTYAERMRAFKNVYGSVQLQWVRLSMHMDASANPRDKRPFAYVYVLWQDDAHEFHMFRERWIKDDAGGLPAWLGSYPTGKKRLPREND